MAKKLTELSDMARKSFQDGYKGDQEPTQAYDEKALSLAEKSVEEEKNSRQAKEISENKKSVEESKVENNSVKKTSKQKKEKEETKSKRFPLLIKPSLYRDLEKIAYVNILSVNEQINQYLEEARKKDKDKVRKFDEFRHS